MLRPSQTDGAARPCVAGIGAALMLRDTDRKVVAGRAADVVRIVGAFQHVDKRAHRLSVTVRPAMLNQSFGRVTLSSLDIIVSGDRLMRTIAAAITAGILGLSALVS